MMILIFGPCLWGGFKTHRMSDKEDSKYQFWIYFNYKIYACASQSIASDLINCILT